MRHEWPCRRPAVQHLEHRGLDFHEVAFVHDVAQHPHHVRTSPCHLLGLRTHDQVDVTLPDPGFLVEGFVRDRKRTQRLGGHRPRGRHDRELATTRSDDLAGGRDNIADVDQTLPVGQCVVADLGQRQHELKLGAFAFSDRGEAEFSGVTNENDPSGDRHLRPRFGAGLQIAVLCAQGGQRRGRFDSQRVGLGAFGEQRVTFLATYLHLLGKIVFRCHLAGIVGHDRAFSSSVWRPVLGPAPAGTVHPPTRTVPASLMAFFGALPAGFPAGERGTIRKPPVHRQSAIRRYTCVTYGMAKRCRPARSGCSFSSSVTPSMIRCRRSSSAVK